MTYTYSCLDCDYTREHNRPQRGKRCKPCANKLRGLEQKDLSKTTCPLCGNTKSYKGKTCKSCVDMKGENNPMHGVTNTWLREYNLGKTPEEHWNWKGGNSGRSGKQIQWAKDIKLSFNNTCDCCSYSRVAALEAHHYESGETQQDNFDLDNGVALCSNCHKEFHKTYGYGNNTLGQYKEFKESY